MKTVKNPVFTYSFANDCWQTKRMCLHITLGTKVQWHCEQISNFRSNKKVGFYCVSQNSTERIHLIILFKMEFD